MLINLFPIFVSAKIFKMKKSLFLILFIFTTFHSKAQFKIVSYMDEKQELKGLSYVPVKENKDKSGILILPAWKGIDNHSKESAKKLSGMGYHVFIADIYGIEPDTSIDNAEAAKKSSYYKENYKEYQKRTKLALDELLKNGANPNSIAIIGYCFGGTGALEAARGELAVKTVVSFHGGLKKDPKRENKPIAAKVLVLHGADDPYVPAEEITTFQQEMRDSKADWQMVYYSDAVHAFSDPYAGSDKSKGAAFNEKAAKRSWENMLIFLRETLRN